MGSICRSPGCPYSHVASFGMRALTVDWGQGVPQLTPLWSFCYTRTRGSHTSEVLAAALSPVPISWLTSLQAQRRERSGKFGLAPVVSIPEAWSPPTGAGLLRKEYSVTS